MKIRNCSTCLRDRPTHLMVYEWGEWVCKTVYEAKTDEEKENSKICHKIDEISWLKGQGRFEEAKNAVKELGGA